MSDTNASNPSPSDSLMMVYEGWDGYRRIINAVAPLPDAVAQGIEPFRVIGAMAGG